MSRSRFSAALLALASATVVAQDKAPPLPAGYLHPLIEEEKAAK